MDQIAHYMPNTQRLLFMNRAHGVGGKPMTALVRAFLNQPYSKIASQAKTLYRINEIFVLKRL
jgi:hypothetical protein